MLEETADGLYCSAGDFHIDPWGAVRRAVITHAHGDHARPGSAAYLCAEPSAPLLRGASTRAPSSNRAVRRPVTMGATRVSFHPAGHVLGSAQIRIEGPDGVVVVSGDYKRAPDPTCLPFEVVRAATRSSRSRRSRCRSSAGIRPAGGGRARSWPGGTRTGRPASPRCSSATRWERRSACWPSWRG